MDKKYYECSWPTCGCDSQGGEPCAAEAANDRLDDICEECEHPRTSELHRQHCPEAIRG